MTDALVSSLNFSRVGEYELAFVDGVVEAEDTDTVGSTPMLNVLAPEHRKSHKYRKAPLKFLTQLLHT